MYAFRTDSYNTLHSSLRISGIHRNRKVIVVTMEMYLLRGMRNFEHIFWRAYSRSKDIKKIEEKITNQGDTSVAMK